MILTLSLSLSLSTVPGETMKSEPPSDGSLLKDIDGDSQQKQFNNEHITNNLSKECNDKSAHQCKILRFSLEGNYLLEARLPRKPLSDIRTFQTEKEHFVRLFVLEQLFEAFKCSSFRIFCSNALLFSFCRSFLSLAVFFALIHRSIDKDSVHCILYCLHSTSNAHNCHISNYLEKVCIPLSLPLMYHIDGRRTFP